MKQVESLTVMMNGCEVGQLRLDPSGKRCVFQYAKSWLKDGFAISPLKLTGYLTQDPRQVEQMFRRMVFNVLVQNKDDHAKNFSFIYRNGQWQLAPAYDLTVCPQGCNGEHATTVNHSGNPTDDDMLKAAESIRISAKRAKEIIADIREKI